MRSRFNRDRFSLHCLWQCFLNHEDAKDTKGHEGHLSAECLSLYWRRLNHGDTVAQRNTEDKC